MPSAKRLLLVVTQSEWGGVQSYVLRCAHEAQRRGFAVLVAAGGHNELAKRCKNDSLEYHELRLMTRAISPIHDLRAVQELKKLYATWNPSTIFLHSSKAGILGSIAARTTNIPVVYRIGGWSFLDPVSPVQKLIRRWSERVTATYKDVIVTVHPQDKELALQHRITPRKQLITISNGLDLSAFDAQLLPREDARKQLDAMLPTSAGPLLLTVANFYPTKNLLGYLDAVAILKQTQPNIRVLLVGDGEERHAIKTKCVRLGLTSTVTLAGRRDDITKLLRGADAFILPSLKEGMPWTVLEAMAAGLPCIVTDVGANRWMLGDAGYLVPPGNATSLAATIASVLNNKSVANQKGETARQIVAARFTEAAMWDATFSVLS